jgi:hypothetical protein
VNAFDAPCRARKTRNDPMSVEAAAPNDASAYAMYAQRMVRACPRRSPSVPETSCSAANGRM